MNTKYLIVTLLLIMTSDAFAQSADNSAPRDGDTPNKLIRDSNGRWVNFEEYSKQREDKELEDADTKYRKAMAEMGYPVGPSQKPRKGAPDDYFTLPENEDLSGCMYPQGYSYPTVCVDNKSKLIFDIDKDDQKVLDKIIKAQGKQGKYNKLPKERKRSKDASKITITTVKEYPPQVLVPPIIQKDEEEQR